MTRKILLAVSLLLVLIVPMTASASSRQYGFSAGIIGQSISIPNLPTVTETQLTLSGLMCFNENVLFNIDGTILLNPETGEVEQIPAHTGMGFGYMWGDWTSTRLWLLGGVDWKNVDNDWKAGIKISGGPMLYLFNSTMPLLVGPEIRIGVNDFSCGVFAKFVLRVGASQPTGALGAGGETRGTLFPEG
jgi:hypothetical protein